MWVNSRFGLARYNTDGGLDNSFSGDGRLVTNFADSTDERAYAVAVDANGKIVAAGYATINGELKFALARYNADGSLDNSFSGDGKLVTDLAAGLLTTKGQAAADVVIDANGKIVAAGYVNTNSGRRFALARYNADGSLDKSFSGDGKLVTDFADSTNEQVSALAIDANGKIVAAGYATVNGELKFALARYNADGSLDNSFSGDGKLVTDLGAGLFTTKEQAATDVAVDANGKIVAAGHADPTNSGHRFALVRYNADGSLDKSFSGDGKLVTDFADSTNEQVNAVAIDANGKIVAAGYARPNGQLRFALARYNPDGSLDNTFAGDGKLVTDFANSTEGGANAVAIDANGKIVAAGYARSIPDNLQWFALARYNPDGTLDTTFAGDALVTGSFGNLVVGSEANALDLHDGKIVLAGWAADWQLLPG